MDAKPELTFDWSQPSGELPEDSMGRAEHARNLTKFLINKGKESSYVLNLNAKWGTGKSYFLRRWVNEIEKSYPAVYIDAWSSDHSSDPLLSVVSEVNKKLHELHNISAREQELFKAVAKTIKATAPALVKGLLKGQLKKWTGTESQEFSDMISGEDLAETGAKLVEQAVRAHNEATAGAQEIKNSIQMWLSSVITSKKRHYPLFIFVDELDRCRPTYAIEMLETIKHIFDTKNVVFVVATDRDQLQHSIRAIYGAGFDSRLYLDRFFTRTVTLSNPSRADFIARKISSSETFASYIRDDDNFVFLTCGDDRLQDINALMAGIADGFGWPLRTVSLWLDRIEAAVIISHHRRLDIILLSFMMALETDNADWMSRYLEEQEIFDPMKQDDGLRSRFKTFMISTPWSFSQLDDALAEQGINHRGSPMSDIQKPQISLLDFVQNRLNWLKQGNPDSFLGILEGYERVFRGDILQTQKYGSGRFQSDYHHVAMDIHSEFHKKNRTTLSHYIEICRYSSLMS